jgi:hypothetical protein
LTQANAVATFPRMAISTRLVFDVSFEVYQSIKADLEGIPLIDPTKVPSDHLWRSHRAPTGEEYAADFALACKRALKGPANAPRLLLCTLFYIELLPYDQVRNYMGIRADVWSDWSDQIRDRAGHVILASGMFPPRKYFGERTRPRRAAPHVVPSEGLRVP